MDGLIAKIDLLKTTFAWILKREEKTASYLKSLFLFSSVDF